jgi:hypothetical protein
MAGVGLGIIAAWWQPTLLGIDHGSTELGALHGNCSPRGTIAILLVYLLTALALSTFIWRRHHSSFSAVRHVVIPALRAPVVVPFIELCKPGQAAPYGDFRLIALLIVVMALVARVTVRRHPSTGWAGRVTRPVP